MKTQLETPSQMSNLRFVLDELNDFKKKSETQTPIDFSRLDKVIQACETLQRETFRLEIMLDIAEATLALIHGDIGARNELRIMSARRFIADALEVLHREGEEE